MLRVLLAQNGTCRVDTPINTERIIGNRYATIGLRGIIIVTLVLEHGSFAQHGKTMGETSRNKKLPMIFLT